MSYKIDKQNDKEGKSLMRQINIKKTSKDNTGKNALKRNIRSRSFS